MPEILRNTHFVVTVNPAIQLVRVTRSAVPSESAVQFEAKWMEVCVALDRAGRSGLSLLLDLRAAVGRNDPEYEEAMVRVRPAVMKGFRRVAVLVQTTAGSLQIHRHRRQDFIERLIGSDEAQLLDYLLGAGPHGR
jgi:hypothetical protein